MSSHPTCVPNSRAAEANHASPTGAPSPPAAGNAAEPHLWRFGLRQMMGFIAVLAAFIVLMMRVGGIWQVILASSTALVAAHVLGTMLGTRLRDTSTQVRHWRHKVQGQSDPPAIGNGAIAPFQARSARPGLLAALPAVSKRRFWAPAAGMGAGCLAGGTAVLWILGDETTWAGAALGAFSCGVVGAWGAMILSSFWTIGRQAWAESVRDS